MVLTELVELLSLSKLHWLQQQLWLDWLQVDLRLRLLRWRGLAGCKACRETGRVLGLVENG